MKTASAGLIALLGNSNVYFMRETYTFTLVDGTVLTYTTGEATGTSAVSANEPVAQLLP